MSLNTDSITSAALNMIPGGAAAGQAFDALLSAIPDGGLKDALNKLKFGVLGVLVTAIVGKKYQTGQYRLGERFMRHILQNDPGSYSKVPDEIVPTAQMFFTIALGVDINNDEDLQSLYTGTDAYLQRPDKTNIPRAAIDRAVMIMKYWTMLIPNTTKYYIPWPIEVIYKLPSDPKTMGYHSSLINKDLPVPMENKSGETNIKKGFPWIWAFVAVAVIVIVILFVKHKKIKTK